MGKDEQQRRRRHEGEVAEQDGRGSKVSRGRRARSCGWGIRIGSEKQPQPTEKQPAATDKKREPREERQRLFVAISALGYVQKVYSVPADEAWGCEVGVVNKHFGRRRGEDGNRQTW